ncbi:hypothetical protein BC943DRAFT_379471 [Umbelopsis sp. AD052]|nr:hypothetical protein BC943DRAFT_379471 [Umbelopsis sp. AD052]
MSNVQGSRTALSPPNRALRPHAIVKGLSSSTFGKNSNKLYTTPSPTLSMRSVFKKSFMRMAIASAQSLRHKKILPTSPQASDIPKGSILATVRTALTVTKPIVHYNGPIRSLDEFSKETMEWLQKGAVAEGAALNSRKKNAVVFKKALTQGKRSTPKGNRTQFVPKGLFYFRVLQITSKSSAKCRDVRCELQIENEVCSSELMRSTRCGKSSAQANFDETFLFDVEGPFVANLSIYSQAKGSSFLRSNKKALEVCLGKESIEFDTIGPTEKRIHRIDLKGWPENSSTDNFQILVSIGLHVNHRTMAVVNQTRFYEDYLTVYVRSGMTPRWRRYWAILKGSNLGLFDFEYREDRPPIAIIPLQEFLSAFHPAVDDDERQVDVGSMGLALQFSDMCLSTEMQKDERLRDLSIFERRMYILADNMISLSQWEKAFEYISLVMGECRGNCRIVDTEVLAPSESHSEYSGIYQLYDQAIPQHQQEDATKDLFKYLW